MIRTLAAGGIIASPASPPTHRTLATFSREPGAALMRLLLTSGPLCLLLAASDFCECLLTVHSSSNRSIPKLIDVT